MKQYKRRSTLRPLVDELERRTQGPYAMDENWVRSAQVKVVCAETGSKMGPGQAVHLARACESAGIDRLVGIVNDPLIDVESMVFEVRPDMEDLAEFDSLFFPLNCVLCDPESSVTLLATVLSYSILAGPPKFVLDFEPSPDGALFEFREFVNTQPEQFRAPASRALELFKQYHP